MPQRVWTARARSSLLAALIFIFFFIPNDCVFHCLNNFIWHTHQSWWKIFIIHCHHEFLPLGGAITKESVFWLLTPIYLITHSKTLYPHIPFFFRKCEMSQTHFFELLPGNFTNLHETLHTAPLDYCSQNGVQRKSRFNTMAKLGIHIFLAKITRTGSVAYLHIGVST